VRPDGASERARWQHSGIQAPEAFLGANESGWHSFGYFSFAIERKVTRRKRRNSLVKFIKVVNANKHTRLRGETRNAYISAQ